MIGRAGSVLPFDVSGCLSLALQVSVLYYYSTLSFVP